MSRLLNEIFHGILLELNSRGIETSPRGMKVKEILAYNLFLENPRDRVLGFPARKVSKKYLLAELIWYLSGSNTIEMIKEYAPFWSQIVNEDKTVNSAYGYRIWSAPKYIGFDQWKMVQNILLKDKDSRQAIININLPVDYEYDNKDVPCTLSLQFFIRENKLHLSVTMRSNDVILGFVNDVFQFTMLQELMMLELRANGYHDLSLGHYYHHAGSMHIYERHFEMMETILQDPICENIIMPEMQVSDTRLSNMGSLIQLEENWSAAGKNPEYNFEEDTAFNSLSSYWQNLVKICFGDQPWTVQ